jgi:hypothetical protein
MNGAALAIVPEKRIHAQPSFLDRIDRQIHIDWKGKIQPNNVGPTCWPIGPILRVM